MEKILAIGAHIDDIEIGCGGSLIQHSENGDEIYLAILKSNEELTGSSIARYREQEKTAEIIGVEEVIHFNGRDHTEYIVQILDSVKATWLYIPWKHDCHQDHQRAHNIGLAVGRRMTMNVLEYLTISSFKYYPNVFRAIDLDRKIKLVSCFESQLPDRPHIMKRMVAQNKYFGSLISKPAAEGFVFHRMILK